MDVVLSWWRYADASMLLPCVVLALVLAVVCAFVLDRYLPYRLPRWFRRALARVTRRRPVATGIDDVRAAAGTVLTALAESLAQADAAAADPDLYERAGLARSGAERYLASERMTDVVGALVLSRSGLDDLRLAGGSDAERFRPCYVNPLHDDARHTVSFGVGQGEVEVPVCRRCRTALRDHTAALDALPSDTVPDAPYFEDETVWALTGYGALVEDLPTALYRLHVAGEVR